MAVFNVPNYLAKDGFGMSLNIRRGNPNPLDNSSVWASLAAAQNYAQTDPVAYVGQILTVVTDVVVDGVTVKTATAYVIDNEAGDLKEVGSSPVGDEKSITVSEDGTVSLYGIAGLALTREEEDGSTTNITYQPLLVNGKLTWVEPSATTVEGLATEIEGIKTRVSALETGATDIGNRMTAAEGEIDALQADSHTHENADVLNGITSDKISAWDAAEQNAKDYADSLAGNYDASGAAAAVQTKLDEEVTRAKAAEEANAAAAKAADDKAVAAQGEIDALEEKIGEVTEGKTVVEMIADAKTEATYDDTALAGRVAAIEGDYLKGEDRTALEGQIATAKAEAISEAVTTVLGEGTHEDFDTLKEVADWILSDTTGAAALITRVSNIEADYLKGADKTELANEIAALGDFIGDLPEGATSTTVIAYIQEVIDGLKIGDYAKAADLTALADRVTAAEGKIAALEAVGAEKNIIASVDTAELAVDGDRKLSIVGVAQDKITGLTNAAGNAETLANLLNSKVDKIEGSRLLTSKEAEKLEKLVMDEHGNVGISGTISAENVISLDDLLGAKVDVVEGMGLSANNLTNELLAKLNGIAEGAQVNAIDAVSDEFTISADGKILNVKAIDKSKITGLVDALNGKVDVIEGSRLMTDAEGTKLAGIAEGAEVNLIDIIQVNGVALDITDKTVNIKATDIVKASDEVTVAEDGTLGIGSISTDKLIQGSDTLILNGGSATA
jgi:hypothetical protein